VCLYACKFDKIGDYRMTSRALLSVMAAVVAAGGLVGVNAVPAAAALPTGTIVDPPSGSSYGPGDEIVVRVEAADTEGGGHEAGVRIAEGWLYAIASEGAPTDFSEQNPGNEEAKIWIGEADLVSGDAAAGTWELRWTVPTSGFVEVERDGDHGDEVPAGETRLYEMPSGAYQIQVHLLDDEWIAAPGVPGFTQAITVNLDTGTQQEPPPPPPPGEELVRNGDLAASTDGMPDCFGTYGWGENTPQWTYAAGAMSLDLSDRVSGDWKLMPSMSATCAVPVAPGDQVDLSIDYSGGSGADLTLFHRVDGTWQYWYDPGALSNLPAASTMQTVTHRTRTMPTGTDYLSFGLSLDVDGVLTTDNYSATLVGGQALTVPGAPTGVTATAGDASADVTWTAPADDGGSAITSYEARSSEGQTCSPASLTDLSCTVTGLTNGASYTFTVTATNAVGTSDPSAASPAVTPEAATPATPENLTTNGDLEGPGDPPEGWQLAGWGDNTVQAGATDIAHSGAAAYRIEVSNRVNGDWKLLPEESTAPVVVPGTTYDLSVWYRSTSANNSVTLFKHTADGWSYWTDIQTLPVAADWTQVEVTTPEIEAGTDKIAWGVSIFGDGVLITDDYRTTPTQTPPDGGGGSGLEVTGRWSVLEYEMPVRTVHTTLLRDGRLLLVAGSGNDPAAFEAGTFETVVWDPDTGEFSDVPTPEDMFCAGHVTLPDGRVLLQGGTSSYPETGTGAADYGGLKSSYIFDPATDTFSRVNDANEGHWYPTLTMLGNGDVWMAGGLKEDTTGAVNTEMFDTSAEQWLPTGEVPQTWSFWGLYPHMVLMADGRLFYTGGHVFGDGLPGTGASIYDWQTGAINDVAGLRQKDLRDQAGSVLLPPAQEQRVLIAGGGNINTNPDAIGLTDQIDLRDPVPSYEPVDDMPGLGKMYLNLTLLPDRTVLASNGAQHNRADDVLTAAIYQPDTGTWTSVAPDPVARNYHSTALLLPDGRVVALGSNPADNTFEMQISIYEPPYLFKGDRPTVSGVPAAAEYGQTISMETTGDVVEAQLLRPMSVTHQSDPNARLVDLPQNTSGGQTTVTIPDNPNVLPPGPYMLMVTDSQGVPSIASWITVN
jgi:hypothetical protein